MCPQRRACVGVTSNSIVITASNTNQIPVTSSHKILGFILDEDLSWKSYIMGDLNHKGLLNILASKIGQLKILSKVSNFRTLLSVANCIFMSHVHYGASIWGGATTNLLKRIQIVQNKAIRVICQGNRYSELNPLYDRTNWLTIRQIIAYCTIMNTKKYYLQKRHISCICNFNNSSQFMAISLDFLLVAISIHHSIPYIWLKNRSLIEQFICGIWFLRM